MTVPRPLSALQQWLRRTGDRYGKDLLAYVALQLVQAVLISVFWALLSALRAIAGF